MPDREKVIKGLTDIYDEAYSRWVHCQYTQDKMLFLIDKTMPDALALLREQEPVTMKPSYFNYVCSGCGSEIDGEFIDYTGGKIKFCPYCGRKVKWDGDR